MGHSIPTFIPPTQKPLVMIHAGEACQVHGDTEENVTTLGVGSSRSLEQSA